MEVQNMFEILFVLTLSWRRPLSYRNQSTGYDNGFRRERVKKTNVLHLVTPNILTASSYATQVNQRQSIESILMSINYNCHAVYWENVVSNVLIS